MVWLLVLGPLSTAKDPMLRWTYRLLLHHVACHPPLPGIEQLTTDNSKISTKARNMFGSARWGNNPIGLFSNSIVVIAQSMNSVVMEIDSAAQWNTLFSRCCPRWPRGRRASSSMVMKIPIPPVSRETIGCPFSSRPIIIQY